jgi:predicted patatin/cPLA2 family phospholipase
MDELKEILMQLDFKSFHDLKIMNFIEKLGFDDGEKVMMYIQKYTELKNIDKNITFEELYSKTGVLFTICVTNITKNCSEYHNAIHTPQLSILQSLKMTTCVPFFFMPIEWNGCYYCDGALIEPYPFHYSKIHSIPSSHRIGVWLINTNDYMYLMNQEYKYTFEEPMGYIFTILLIIYTQMLKNKYKKINKNTIAIHFECSSLNINISEEEKKEMYMKGVNQCRKFMRKKLRLIHKKRMVSYFFHTWKNNISCKDKDAVEKSNK